MIGVDDRKKSIVKAIVQNYILTGKPVGSRAVAESCGLRLSTATIRHEMSALEDMGLLTQPHTSAGRVPTDIAYRYYVDMLMGEPWLSQRDIAAVEMLFAARKQEIEGLLHEASLLLSRLTHTTAMVFAPLSTSDKVRHVDLIRMSGKRVMAIIITMRGQVGRRLLHLKEAVSEDTVERASKFLDRELACKSLEEIDADRIIGRSRFGGAGKSLLEAALSSAREYLGSFEERVFIGGTANIVREMDSTGSDWVQVLLEAMEKQYFIIDLLKDLIKEERLTVRIGEENPLIELRKFAFVGTSYPIGTGLLGSLGVVGPTCMDYAHTIGMVQYMADNLGRRLLETAD